MAADNDTGNDAPAEETPSENPERTSDQEAESTATPGTDSEESNHWLRRLMDNPWALLVLGIVIPTVSYTLWGIIELMMIPDAPKPPFVP